MQVVTCEGYEADDILGTLAAACTAQHASCDILTGDRDSLQLVRENVTVRLATNKETILFTPERFQEEYGFAPLSLIDLKALMGDSSDNIAGVAGVGQKTASKLIQAWGTVENLYAHLEEAGLTKSVHTKLVSGQDAARESKWLATIVTDVPVDTALEDYVPKPVQAEKVRELLLELEMAKLLEKLKLSDSAEAAPAQETHAPEAAVTLTEAPLTAEVLGTYEKDFYAGEAALTKNKFGKGEAYYIAARTGSDMLSVLYGEMIETLHIEKALDCALPHGVTAHIRHGEKENIIFVENYTESGKTVELPRDYKLYGTDQTVNSIKLAPFGIALLSDLTKV